VEIKQIWRNRLRLDHSKGGQITLTSTVGRLKFSFELEFNENQATVEKKQKFTTNLF
jgi:hypothetical protein